MKKRPKRDALALIEEVVLLCDAATNDARQTEYTRAQQYQARGFGSVGAGSNQRSRIVDGTEAAGDQHEVRVSDVVRGAVVKESEAAAPGNESVAMTINGALVEVTSE